ncbi:fructose-specific PTS transporter subunit EIIC [Kiritimatiellaeota bacterium B1221]|nr:fructose-specific PTS transporter subunit EIIC [Kiritimatiellaeota bacterium B1221]
MKKLFVVFQFPKNEGLSRMAWSALEAEAALRDIELLSDTIGIVHMDEAVLEAKTCGADALLFVSSGTTLTGEKDGVTLLAADRPGLLHNTVALLEAVAPLRKPLPSKAPCSTAAAPAPQESKFLVGVTSCPTGIAHTFMAAEALQKGAEAMGYTMKVETRGSVGAKNELTPEEIERADAVIVAADATVETTRFAGKKLLETGTKAAIHDSKKLIKTALELTPTAEGAPAAKTATKKPVTGGYKHLMTGVSHMLPLIVAGGLLIALAFAIGGINAGDQEGTLAWALMQIGGSAAFALFIPVLAAYISFSIADRPGLTAGFIGGMLAANIGAGFLGGIAAGFFAGYFTLWLNRSLKLPDQLAGLKPVLLLPLISSLVIGLSMIFLIGPPVKIIMDVMTSWLSNMQDSSALLLGLILGCMMAFDMGGPVNKAAYTFAVGLVSTEIYAPMAAVMAAGMTPPLGIALATLLFKNRFSKDELQARNATAVLGAAFITEGAIPYAAADPLRVIPSLMVGSATAGSLSMYLGCKLMVPHGGIFVLAIPNAITNGLGYLISIVAGTLVTVGMLYMLKRPQTDTQLVK